LDSAVQETRRAFARDRGSFTGLAGPVGSDLVIGDVPCVASEDALDEPLGLNADAVQRFARERPPDHLVKRSRDAWTVGA
jgi:hypothetical protein